MITVSVMYPYADDLKFDLDYYLNTHIKLVEEKWHSLGLKSIRVLKGLAGGAPGSKPPYAYMALVDFDSIEDFQGAIGAHGVEIMGDIPNFTNGIPTLQISDVTLG